MKNQILALVLIFARLISASDNDLFNTLSPTVSTSQAPTMFQTRLPSVAPTREPTISPTPTPPCVYNQGVTTTIMVFEGIVGVFLLSLLNVVLCLSPCRIKCDMTELHRTSLSFAFVTTIAIITELASLALHGFRLRSGRCVVNIAIFFNHGYVFVPTIFHVILYGFAQDKWVSYFALARKIPPRGTKKLKRSRLPYLFIFEIVLVGATGVGIASTYFPVVRAHDAAFAISGFSFVTAIYLFVKWRHDEGDTIFLRIYVDLACEKLSSSNQSRVFVAQSHPIVRALRVTSFASHFGLLVQLALLQWCIFQPSSYAKWFFFADIVSKSVTIGMILLNLHMQRKINVSSGNSMLLFDARRASVKGI